MVKRIAFCPLTHYCVPGMVFRGGGGPPRERLRASPSTGPRSWRVTHGTYV